MNINVANRFSLLNYVLQLKVDHKISFYRSFNGMAEYFVILYNTKMSPKKVLNKLI